MCACTTCYSPIHLLMDIRVAPVLAIVSNAAMNMGIKYQFESLLHLLLGTYLEVELLDHMVILCLILWGTAILFPQWPHHFIDPLAMGKCSSLTTSLFIFYFFSFLFFFLLKHQCVVTSHVAPNPGVCPDWESNWWPSGLQPVPPEPHQPGLFPAFSFWNSHLNGCEVGFLYFLVV